MKISPKKYLLYCKYYGNISIKVVKICKKYEYPVYYFKNLGNIGLANYQFSEPFLIKMIKDGRLKEIA